MFDNIMPAHWDPLAHETPPARKEGNNPFFQRRPPG